MNEVGMEYNKTPPKSMILCNLNLEERLNKYHHLERDVYIISTMKSKPLPA